MFLNSNNKAAQICNTVNDYDETLRVKDPVLLQQKKAFASCEHLAHDIPYDLAKEMFIDPNDPPEVSVFDEDGTIRKYRVIRLHSNHDGLVGFVLYDHTKDNPRLHIVFRGTKNNPSVLRDVEKPAPGYISFSQNAPQILTQLQHILDGFRYKPSGVHLYISGHSLGGADAQYCTTEVIKALSTAVANGDTNSSWHLIKALTLNHVNSAGVTNLTAAKCKYHANLLAQTSKPHIKLNILRVGGDGVQQSGESNILHDATPNIAQIALLKVENGWEGWFNKRAAVATTLVAVGTGFLGQFALVSKAMALGYMLITSHIGHRAHTSHHFKDRDPSEANHQIFTNDTAEGSAIISQKLTNQSWVLTTIAAAASAIVDISPSITPSSISPQHSAEFEVVQNEPSRSTSPEDVQNLLTACIRQKLAKMVAERSCEAAQRKAAARAEAA
ncbi:MAG TPA: hypothetical protein VLG38_01635, partial [Gammaproteobacteria bacterium]|nr:hypothetical protein [Gammaproteobacteria bacterium]